MDFDTLFYLAIAAIYLLFQVLSGRKKKKRPAGKPLPKQPAPDVQPVGRTQTEPTLDDALREIRLALGMDVPAEVSAPPQPPPQPPPAPTPQPAAKPPPPVARPKAPERPEEFHAYPTRYADAEFEAMPTAEGRVRSIHQPARPPRPVAPPAKTWSKKTLPAPKTQGVYVQKTTPPASIRRADLLRRLHSPEAAREAFAVSEILAPPRALRRR